ncbi:MAG TPA: phosphatase PAP2 family protein [Nevskiaceae bacterium]|nr:phosphatase PAP2 family protein [Nevskiaceae bacterium]
MKSALCLLGGLSVAAFSIQAHAVNELSDTVKNEATAGDVLLYSLPLVAFGMTFVMDDPAPSPVPSLRYDTAMGFDSGTFIHLNGHPRHDLFLAMGRTIAITYALKYSVHEERPNDEDSHSFPSGHAAVTFAGAEFIRKEYGWSWGIPAYVASTFVAFSRVNAREHYTWDVISGATIGVLSNHDFHEYFSHYGTLRFGPTFNAPHYMANAPYRDDPLATLSPAPSLSAEFRF